MHITEALPHLPAAIVRETVDTLIAVLPPPPTDTPHDRAARDAAAIATIATLRPADAAEALLAAQIVGAHFNAMDRLHAASQPGQPVKDILRHRSEATAMMRQMQSGLATLLRMQAPRGKADIAVHPAATAPGEGRQTEPLVRRTHNLPAPRRTKLRLVH
jgi:hypothetical protein